MIRQKKSSYCTEKKNGEIQDKNAFSGSKCISIEKSRNTYRSSQNSKTECRNYAGISIFEFAGHKKRIQQHRKKQQLHVFPYGFADRRKKAHDEVLIRPFVQKMRKCSDSQNKKYAGRSIVFQLFVFFHEKSPR